MKIATVGIDLAKNVFQVHAVDERGKAVLRRQLRRTQVAVFFANLPPCLIGIEACASAHHWARALQRLGHTVRFIAPQFVKPYVKTNKNDVADAEAICKALCEPSQNPWRTRCADKIACCSTDTKRIFSRPTSMRMSASTI